MDRELVIALLRARDEDAKLAAVAALGVTIEQWQIARSQLGLGPVEFEGAREEFRELRDVLVYGLASLAAHSPSVDLDDARVALNQALEFQPASSLLQRRRVAQPDGAALLERMRQALAVSDRVGLLVARVDELLIDPPESAGQVAIAGAAHREVEEYRERAETLRSELAAEALNSLICVAAALAQRYSLNLDELAIRSDARVSALVQGWWANRFALLEAAQRALRSQGAAPLADLLSHGGAFQDPDADWRKLWLRFAADLGPPPSSESAPKQAVLEVGGRALSEGDIYQDLRDLGSEGIVGHWLREAVVDEIAFASIRSADREDIEPRGSKRTGVGRSQPGTKPPRAESNADRELNGLLGEVFVLEQFRRVLPGFDETAWVSENRRRFGLAGIGATDETRFDFNYVDVTGSLAGRSAPTECHIEVKATSGTGDSPFPMSVPEWEHARRCHQTGQALYVIVRVADIRSQRPRIHDVVPDPVALWQRGKLTFDAQSLWIQVGGPISAP